MTKKLITVFLAICLAVSLVGCSLMAGKDTDRVVIGGKNFTEQDILVYIVKDLLEDKTKLKVDVKPYLGGTQIVAQAMDRGDIDIYVEYSGTALLNLLKEQPIKDSQQVYDKVKAIYKEKKHIVWLEPLGFNNTYTLTMRAEDAQRLGIEKFSDLAPYVSRLKMGTTAEFQERPDGYPGLKKVYDFDFTDISTIDPGLTYVACKEGEVDVIDAFATDGRITAFNLKVLKDDKNFFPPYYAAPIVREETLEKHPEIAEVLNLLVGKLDDKAMSELNSKVDIDKQDSKTVAHEWLKERGLISK